MSSPPLVHSSSRRVSLPVTLGRYPHWDMLLSPNYSPTPSSSSSCARRSIPSTPLPNGTRRSLPPTPPDVDVTEADEEEDAIAAASNRQRLRSFDLRDGTLLDKGFQKSNTTEEEEVQIESDVNCCQDNRRATCPDIYLFDDSNMVTSHVVVRIYGTKNSGKKSLANRLHHIATSMTPDRIDPDSNEARHYSNHTRFLLNGRELTLEILIESALESSPFTKATTIYLVNYSADSRSSFVYATQLLESITSRSANHAILIANKIDIVRNQAVPSVEGRAFAKSMKCDYLEVSALMAMNIDELWTAILHVVEHPNRRRRRSWVERLLNRGKDVAKSAEGVFHRILP